MGKKIRNNSRDTHLHAVEGGKKESAFREGGWSPLDEQIDRNRDKKYVKNVKPRTEGQKQLMDAIASHNLSLAIGPAGTGKTYLAISAAVEALEAGKIERIVLSRPRHGGR